MKSAIKNSFNTFNVTELRRQSCDIKTVTGINPHGELGTWGAVFGILSTIIGGGLVAIPWAFYSCGFPIAIFLLMLSAV